MAKRKVNKEKESEKEPVKEPEKELEKQPEKEPEPEPLTEKAYAQLLKEGKAFFRVFIMYEDMAKEYKRQAAEVEVAEKRKTDAARAEAESLSNKGNAEKQLGTLNQSIRVVEDRLRTNKAQAVADFDAFQKDIENKKKGLVAEYQKGLSEHAAWKSQRQAEVAQIEAKHAAAVKKFQDWKKKELEA